ncbi:GTP-binding protein Der [Bacteroidetes bacterium UKL13-3]|jgi:GTP-binding protein|nr:GTP-binding protein Der [Bacteroidetes bacterium UKL13-3]HCP94384.1 ribosome biogenesis GTPase Der [Bacteroidota bacterium]
MGNIVAIVGRPNVGKSTLFNRLVGNRKAIVADFSGITRDRHYGNSEWNGREFSVIDTGGFVAGSDDIFEAAINSQVKIAIEEADVMIFMVDVEEGITALDKSVANLLRRSKKPVMLVVNKVDNHDRMHSSSEFYGLGFDKMFTVSSASGSGTGDLLDEVVANLPPVDENAEEVEKERLPRIAIVGRPNVGKSSLVNALLGEERNIVTEIAGTTRDTIDTLYNGYGHKFLLIDTAGIRRKAKVKEDIEFYSVMRSVKAIEDCDIVVLVIDATVGIDSQDINLVHLAETNSKGLVVLVNKWDLVEKDHKTSTEFEKVVRKKLEPFTDVPIVFTSALTKQRIHKAIEMAMLVYENRTRKIPTRKLNDVMLAHIEAYQPPAIKGKYVKIKFITQLPGQSPKFAFFCNLPQYINDSYKRYLENKMRESFDLHGVPITIFMRKK